MKKWLVLIVFLPCLAMAQTDSILSGLYKYKTPVGKMDGISSRTIYEGKAFDFDWMQLNACLVLSTDLVRQQVPNNEEQLLILKSGIFQVKLGNELQTLRPGSVVFLTAGQSYAISCNLPGEYYTLKYRNSKQVKPENKPASLVSFIRNKDSLVFKRNNNGGGRVDYFEMPTSLQKRFEVHMTTLKEGLRSHEPHTHRAEEIIIIVNGDTEMLIGDQTYAGKLGDVYFLGSNVLHAIKNIGQAPCMYFAIQFE